MDYPPDDLTLRVREWLKNEIYPGLLQEPWTDRADVVWISGSGGFVGLWSSGLGSHLPPLDRMEFIKHELYRKIRDVKFRTPLQSGPNKIHGQLKVDGLGFRDATGLPIRPLLCHFGEAFSAFVRRPQDVLRELDLIQSAGYHGIRFWDVLGYYDLNRPGDATAWKAWAGKEVTPVEFTAFSGRQIYPTPDYYYKLELFLHGLKSRGLVAQHSRGDLNAWNWAAILEHCRKVGEIQRRVGAEVIALNESLNEAFQNGVPEVQKLKEMGDALGNHAIRGTSSGDDGYGGETPEEVARLKRDVAIIHGYRGGESLNRIGHIHSVGYETLPHANVPGWQGEPAGPGSGVSVGREESPEALVLMAAMAHMTHQAWVFMSGHGVFWNGSISDMKGFKEVPQVLSFLPPDIMFWPTVIHGGQRWKGTRIFAVPEGDRARVDSALHPDGRAVIIVYGSPGMHLIPCERAFDGDEIHPLTGGRTSFSARPGELRRMEFERGRILVGRIV